MENAQRLRDRVGAAVAAHLAERGVDELTLPVVARRAGISVATAYRHFPTRESLLDEYARWVRARIGVPRFETTLDGWPAQIVRAFTAFDEMGAAVKSQLALPSLPAFKHVRAQRLAATERMLAPVLEGLDERARKRALGTLSVLTGLHAWHLMHEDWGLDGPAAGEAAAWAVRTLLDALRREAKPAAGAKVETAGAAKKAPTRERAAKAGAKVARAAKTTTGRKR